MRAHDLGSVGNIHPTWSTTLRRILYPTDLTRSSGRTLNVALRLARQNSAEVIIVHALPPPTPIYELESPGRPDAEAALAKMSATIRSLGIRARTVLIKGTAPVAGSIARCAKCFAADLIVMGTGRRTGLSRLLAGSIAAKVVRIAPCPILVVKNCKRQSERRLRRIAFSS